MMPAFSRAWASLIVVANEFQLFQPIGGVSASAVRLAGVFFSHCGNCRDRRRRGDDGGHGCGENMTSAGVDHDSDDR
jgi:hypothetical protein